MNNLKTTRGGLDKLGKQKGFGLLGLIFWGGLLASAGYVGMQAVPMVTEYMAILKSVKATKTASTPQEVREIYARREVVEYITSVTSKDLETQQLGDGRIRTKFAYTREIPLGGPVSLLFRFSGQSQ